MTIWKCPSGHKYNHLTVRGDGTLIWQTWFFKYSNPSAQRVQNREEKEEGWVCKFKGTPLLHLSLSGVICIYKMKDGNWI